jgi:K+-sensing histidine kinase KdpD
MATLFAGASSAINRIPKMLRDLLVAASLVLAAGGAALLLHAVGDRRLSMIFMLPVLFSGLIGGMRAGIFAATLSYLVYDMFVVPPIFSLFTATTQDTVALVVFATAAVAAGLGSGVLRDEQRRAAERSRTILMLLDSNSFFTITPNEAAIRQRLADGVAAISGAGAVFIDAEGRLTQRAGDGANWVGGLEGELCSLARQAMRHERGLAANGRFRARAARHQGPPLGAVVWLGPVRRPHTAPETDMHIDLMVQLASTALARGRRELQG